MKKPNKHLEKLRESRNRKIRLNQLRNSKRRRNARLHPQKVVFEKQALRTLKLQQRAVATSLHSQFRYPLGLTKLEINGEFGLETAQNRNQFLDLAARCIDFDTSELTLDITNATRIWPSAVVLLCSLKEWVEFGIRYVDSDPPTINSNDSRSDAVTSYLNHCGFHNYVGRSESKVSTRYNSKEVVRIKRERDRNSVEPRELELFDLIKKNSSFSADEIEYFDDVILTETFNNVIEHGVPNHDQGWFILAQCHFHHRFISLCIADTGIGIRNTLMLGPQGKDIGALLPNRPERDGDFIELAMTANISGSFDADTKKGFLVKRYDSGSQRGNGLKRILDTCHLLKVDMSLLSHHGYAFYDSVHGRIQSGAFPRRIFAGTMYNYIIPAKECLCQ